MNQPLPKLPEVVLWDWNGTLFDDAWLCHDVMNGVLARRDMPTLSFEEYRQVFTFPVIEYYRRLGFDFEKESFEVVGAEFIEEYERRRLECSLRPEVPEILETLDKRGHRQAILSAYHHETLEELTHHFGIRHHFEHIAGHHDIYAAGKLAQGKRLLETLAADRKDILLVGDTAHDAEVAEELGITCILVEGGNQVRTTLESRKVPIAPSLNHLWH